MHAGKNDLIVRELRICLIKFQIIIKIITLTLYKEDIQKLLNGINNFWAIENVDEEVISHIKAIYNYILFVIFIFCLAAIIVASTFSYFGFASNEMILLCYVPEKFYLTYNIVMLIQFLFILGSVFITTGFDSLYMFICYKCIAQLHMIKYKIENLVVYDERDVVLNKCIRHHANLIR